MKVLLTDDVVGLGDIGETVKVRPGYARNYLIPRGLAVESGAKSAKAVAHKMLQIEAKRRRLKVDAEQAAKSMTGISVQLGLRVGTGGKVFGSISARQISEKLLEQGIELDRRRILLNEPIRKLGKRDVRVKLHADVITTIAVEVVSLAATEEEERLETMQARAALEQAAQERDSDQDEEFFDDTTEDSEV